MSAQKTKLPALVERKDNTDKEKNIINKSTWKPKPIDYYDNPLSGKELNKILPKGSENRRMYDRFKKILSYKRSAWTPGEDAMINDIFEEYHHTFDDFGNIYIEVDTGSRVLWSCHTDTVHNAKNCNLGNHLQKVEPFFYEDTIILGLSKKNRRAGMCLGADDGCGIFLMLEMIDAGVPGTYVFHRAEEIGCLGSSYIADNNKHFLSSFDYAIAFDRQDKNEIITEQSFGITASDRFAESLAAELKSKNEKLSFFPSAFGVLTDTNSYAEIIPECTNVGVGYNNQHGPTEIVDFVHMVKLRDALVDFDESSLVVDRDPHDKSNKSWNYYGYSSDWDYSGKKTYDAWDEDYYDSPRSSNDPKPSSDEMEDEEKMAYLCSQYPEIAASFLVGNHVGLNEFFEEIFDKYGIVDGKFFD